MRLPLPLLLLLSAAIPAAPAPSPSAGPRSIATWVGWSENITANFATVTPYLDRISSISLALPLPPLVPKSPPWFQDADVLRFTEMMTRHGVDTYVLLVGDQTNFCTRFGGASCSGRATDPGCRCADPADTTARDATISDAIALVNRFQMTGVDLDYEHLPVKTNATAAGGGLQKSLFQQSSDVYDDRANLVKPFSLFLRQISAALHAKGHKLSQCVGLYPTRDGGASMFYDPAVVGETVDTVRVMNYDMCKPRPPTRQPSR